MNNVNISDDLSDRDSKGNTRLHRAVNKGDLDLVKDLLKNGADINSTNDDGHTPLEIACFCGDLNMAAYLSDHGANPIQIIFN
jgi:ankyrin repeat protein